ncbi:MAG: radical SAM protein [Methanimicrococcus sp.]|nr:radical SAM protein [Methanimicrococcus sp.]
MKYIPAKKMILPAASGSDLFGNTHTMNIYRGCSHGCIYCDSRSECYKSGRLDDDFSEIYAKENALLLIEQELKARRKSSPKMIIGTGSMSDPYNVCEAEFELTRSALSLFNKHKCGISVITKSALVTRDIDIYSEIQSHSPVNIGITITAARDDVCQKIEPNVSTTSDRLNAIKELADADIFSGIHMNPVLPKITDTIENVKTIIEKAAENNAKYVLCYGFGLTLRDGNREYYYENLDKHYPGLKEYYTKKYGMKYSCQCDSAKELFAVFKHECNRHNLLYKSEDINAAWKKQKQGQKQEQKSLGDFG